MRLEEGEDCQMGKGLTGVRWEAVGLILRHWGPLNCLCAGGWERIISLRDGGVLGRKDPIPGEKVAQSYPLSQGAHGGYGEANCQPHRSGAECPASRVRA